MPTQREKIIKKAYEILERKQDGIRYADLIREISKELPDVKINTIHGTIWDFKKKIDSGKIKDVLRPEKGLYILKKYFYTVEKSVKKTKYGINVELMDIGPRKDMLEKLRKKIIEEDFYYSFADYLMNDLDECTLAIPLGGNRFQDKWGTPDVFGVYKFSETDPIKPLVEIVSAEIKTDTNQLITAFGQACAYKLFSHKVYLVIPKDAEKDVARLESLCLRFGIGLILFDSKNPENPKFEIRTRAIKNEPDYFYVNEYLKKLSKEELRKLGL
jgi:hypothetical protein